MKHIKLIVGLLVAYAFPVAYAIAQSGSGSGAGGGAGSGAGGGAGSGAGGGAGSGSTAGAGNCPTGSLCNPLQSDDLVSFLLNILDVLLTFAIPIIVLFIMYAGFLYVTAQGEESKISTAHKALTWSIVGGVIILASKLIITVIQQTIDAL